MSDAGDKWDRRLANWALWCASGSASGRSEGVSSIYSPGRWHYGDGTRKPPPLVGEALDTDNLVRGLPHDLFWAVRAQFCWSGNQADIAQQLGIHPDTLRSRVKLAKDMLETADITQRRARPRSPSAA